MLIRLVKLIFTLAGVVCFSQLAQAQCKQAGDNDSPHGANEFVLLKEKRVGRIHGRVFFPNYMVKSGRVRAEDIVVELYNYSGGDSYEDVNRALREQKRMAACLTGHDGRFSFVGLKQGRYLLRAGTRAHDQYNEVHAILILDPRGTDKGMEIVLTAGT
jgi:hypothetical protein